MIKNISSYLFIFKRLFSYAFFCLLTLLFIVKDNSNLSFAIEDAHLNEMEQYISIEQILQDIAYFEKLINQKRNPSHYEAMKLFISSDGNFDQYFIDCYCALHGMVDSTSDNCKNYFNKKNNGRKNWDSEFFSFLRATNGPIFNKNDKKREISIFFKYPFIEPKNNLEEATPKVYIIKCIIIINGDRTKNIQFLVPIDKLTRDIAGAVINIKINNKTICELYGGKICESSGGYRGWPE